MEVTAKRRLLCHVSHADIQTKNGIVWTAVRHRAECHPYLKKSKLIVVGGWLIYTYLVSTINEDGTRMRKKNPIKYSLVHGWLSATTLDLLFHACLLALSRSGRHERTTYTMYVPAAVIMVLLLYCGWLWCCYYCCPCARRN